MRPSTRPWVMVLLLLCICGAASPPAIAGTHANAFPLPVTAHTLTNGMRLLIVERRDSPTFAAYIRFRVGSVNEPAGQTGLAHLLEHMMFKGTRRFGTTGDPAEQPLLERIDRLYAALQDERAAGRHSHPPDPARMTALQKEIAEAEAEAKRFVVRNEIFDIYRRHGGVRLNASTSRDGTQYYISLPKNRLELWALLESDRIRDPVFREFYTEREVVQEERRQRVDTSPRGQLMEAAVATAFAAVPYRHPVIGWPGELESLTRPQAEAYFRTYYAPNNALAILVGDLDPAETIRVMERYFGPIPAQTLPTAPAFAEPPQVGERRLTIEFPAEPQLLMLYQAPPLGHPDTYPLSVLGSLLGEGRTSRLHKRLVEEKRLASSVSAGPWFLRYAGLFIVQATPRAPHTLAELEAAIEQELALVRAELPTARELGRVRNQLDTGLIRTLGSNAGLASTLGNAWALTGRWLAAWEDRDRIQAVTADDVLASAKRYLVTRQRTVAHLNRGGEPAPARGAGTLPVRQPWEAQ